MTESDNFKRCAADSSVHAQANSNQLSVFARLAGSWSGASKLRDPHNGIDVESQSTAIFTVDCEETLRLQYTWSYAGKPQSGSLHVNINNEHVTALWTDTWHTNNRPMACIGHCRIVDSISVRGTYAAPPGPDWGWRIDLTSKDEHLLLVMWNVWPVEQGGKEELAVETDYTRVGPQ